METSFTASAMDSTKFYILVAAKCFSYILDRFYEILKASNLVYFMQ
jgi:hypothetical protein